MTGQWPMLPRPPAEPPAARRGRGLWWGLFVGGLGAAVSGSFFGPFLLLMGGMAGAGVALAGLLWDSGVRRVRALLSQDPAGMEGPARAAWRDRVEFEVSWRVSEVERGRALATPRVRAEVVALLDALTRCAEVDRADPGGKGLR